MIIDRYLLTQLQSAISPGKVAVLYGPRQVGKTTLVMELLAKTTLKAQLINADELSRPIDSCFHFECACSA